MKYVVQAEVDPIAGMEVDAQPEKMQEAIGKLQALKPIGLYFHTTRRGFTAVVDVPNEDALFEALHSVWVLTKSYPSVSPVVSAEEFPQLLQRVGILK